MEQDELIDAVTRIIMDRLGNQAAQGNDGPASASAASPSCCCDEAADMTGKKVISEKDVRAVCATGKCSIRVDHAALLTALANDYCKSNSIAILRK